MDLRGHQLSTWWPELALLVTVHGVAIWLLLSFVGVITAPASVPIDLPVIGIFAGCLMLLWHRVAQLNARAAKLDRLLAVDEADISKLALSPAMSHALSSPATSTTEGPLTTGVRDAIAAYRLAGFTEDQAQALAREVLRLQVKEAGGWSP